MTNAQSVFSTIPKENRFGIFNGSEPNFKVIRDVLKLDKKDIARAAKVKESSVRWEPGRIPEAVLERFNEWAIAIDLVSQYFNDLDRAVLWFRVPNPFLGGISPRDMIRIGRFKKLFSFIQTALNENKK